MTHAWLLTGPPGSGRSTAARAFAAALQCERGGCGVCHECRTALARQPPRRHAGRHGARVPAGRGRAPAGHARPAAPVARALAGDRPRGRRPAERHLAATCCSRRSRSRHPHRLAALRAEPRRRPRHDPVPMPPRRPARAPGRRRRRAAGPPARCRPGGGAFAARAAGSHVGVARRLALDEGARIRRRDVLRLPGMLTTVGVGGARRGRARRRRGRGGEGRDGRARRRGARRAAALARRRGCVDPPAGGARAGQAAGGEPEAPRHPGPARRARPLAGRPAVAATATCWSCSWARTSTSSTPSSSRRWSGWRARRPRRHRAPDGRHRARPGSASRRTSRRCWPSRR